MYMEIQWKCKSLTFCWPKITGTIFMPCIDAKHIRQPTGKTSECKNKTLSTGAHWSLATIVRTPDTVAISLYFGRPAGTMMHVQEQGQGRTAVCLQAITFSLSIYRHPALSYVDRTVTSTAYRYEKRASWRECSTATSVRRPYSNLTLSDS